MSDRPGVAGGGLAAEYAGYDGLGLAELVARGEATPLELLEAARAGIEALDPGIHAVVHRCFDRAEHELRARPPSGPFGGVPFALKDLGQHLAGVPTGYGSALMRGFVPDFTGTLVERYQRAGLVVLGKTATPEFGLSTTTESAECGPTRNPWNPERTAGGSSGGAAAAVAARMLPMAHGTDGGGSIRIPASCCGVFGLKPTRARVPLGPSQFEGWNGLSCHHALTISVRDSAALLDATAGAELGSPYWAPPPAGPYLDEVGRDPAPLRLALVTESPADTVVDPECRRAARHAAHLCEDLGHRVDETHLPIDDRVMRGAFLDVLKVSIARVLEDVAIGRGRPLGPEDVESVTWATYRGGLATSSVAYSRAIATLHQVGLAMARFHQTYDIVLSPTLGQPPVPLGTLDLSARDLDRYARAVTEFSPFTMLYNVTGQPSMSVPLHWTPDGLPVGVMFSARFGDEATLFRLAGQLERARPWAGRRPVLAAGR
jgi:Asp-tRNA(Asn)/Glu-tRNA(Gln) amidotransferase A subunit family amidase